MMIKRVCCIALYLLSVERPKETTVICTVKSRAVDWSISINFPLHKQSENPILRGGPPLGTISMDLALPLDDE